ncbi:MAG: hypothetical protein JSU77_13275 [Fidelibacterota bacterium]|nr:MAG: hypothetical protein JSU77_13275 [Candidatus Neomarinimicrobiota bacterium]
MLKHSLLITALIISVFLGCSSSEQSTGKNYLFDLGTNTSPLEEHFIRVTEKTTYNQTRGFGWLTAPATAYDGSLIKLYSDLTIDGVLSKSTVVFQVDIPDGEYFLTVTLGSGSLDDQKTMNVEVNGVTFEEQLETPWYGRRLSYRTLRKRVVASKGYIKVSVSGDSAGVGVHAIELRPVVPPDRIRFQTQLEADTAAVAKAARRLEKKLNKNPDDQAARNRLRLLNSYLRAVYFYDIGWWSWAVKETGLSIFNRYWAASDALRQILADESDPLYDRAAYLLGKIHYWLYQEQHVEYNRLEAERFFHLIADKYPRHKQLRMYLGEKIRHNSPCSPRNGKSPLWASKQQEAMCRILEVIHWWVDNRQVENGEMGGKYADDVEMLRWWPAAIFGADDPKARLGYKRLVEGVWNSGLLERGYSKAVEDVEHSAELFSDTHPAMLLMEYGNPTYIERNLISMQNFENTWTGITPRGHRHFKSCYLSASTVTEDPPVSVDVPMNSRATIGGLWVMWYQRSPILMRLFSEWGRAWVEDARRIDKNKPHGLLPSAVAFATDEIGGYSDNWYHPNLGWQYYQWDSGASLEMYNQLLGTSLVTGDPELRWPVDESVAFLQRQAQVPTSETTTLGSPAWAREKLLDPSFIELVGRAKVLTGSDRYDEFLRSHATGYIKYLLTHDKSHLIRACDRLIDNVAYNFELRTSEVKFTDRVYMGGAELLYSMYTGGIGRGGEYPGAAVTWEHTGTDMAILVTEASKTALKILSYNFNREKSVNLRLWRLEEGRYSLRTGRDKDEDDDIDGDETRTEFELSERGERLSISVPSQTLFVFELMQEERSERPLSPRPDLGLSQVDLDFSNPQPKPGDKVELIVTVHNIGSADAHDVQVLFYVDNEQIGMRTIDLIEAPNDLHPRVREVRLPWWAIRGDHYIAVKVKMRGKEITTTNNTVTKDITVTSG